MGFPPGFPPGVSDWISDWIPDGRDPFSGSAVSFYAVGSLIARLFE